MNKLFKQHAPRRVTHLNGAYYLHCVGRVHFYMEEMKMEHYLIEVKGNEELWVFSGTRNECEEEKIRRTKEMVNTPFSIEQHYFKVIK